MPDTSAINCFLPIADPSARLLILGSMPGEASLREQQYYAHPRNLFWPIISEIMGVAPSLPYDARVQALKTRGIALWDVLESCIRISSLDSAIDRASEKPNDFRSFFRSHPDIGRVFFNGAKAEECYRRYILPSLADEFPTLEYRRLPSTSPAHASLRYEEKLEIWRAGIGAQFSVRMK
ncbi:MAG: DNA-deoxyinosine glycosylase [Alphaproteobacteria bacterium]